MGQCGILCLTNEQIEKMPRFSYEGQTFYVKVCEIYDGDTCSIVIVDGACYNYKKIRVRCNGYDSPEIKPLLSVKDRDLEIENAKKAKIYLTSLVENKILKARCGKFDKYGRLLVDFYDPWNNMHINKNMIENGHGIPYFGGTKSIT